jgi:dienelactone hydrolase
MRSVLLANLLHPLITTAFFAVFAVPIAPVRGEEPAAEAGGSFAFRPLDENQVPLPFRLEVCEEIPWQQKPLPTSASTFSICEITFPSPVVTPDIANNTVYGEYFSPTGDAKRPGVIVLHILGGDFELSRLFCRALATRGCSALFVKMPYYGPRRPPGVKGRMVSRDPDETVRGMTQAVKDVRYATAWLASRPEIDADQLGIMGISLGGITSALAFTAEPRLQKACLLLAGGDAAKIAWNAREMRGLRDFWEAKGGTKESFYERMRTIDPVVYGDYVRNRKVLMLNASHDEVIPPASTESLWKAFGKPPIQWWDAGHYTAVRFIFDGMDKTTKFFAPEVSKTE